MPPTGEKYRRLPGRRRSVGSNASLWMGSDHILLVKSAWFREEYKRFYLRDIQAIVVAPGARFYLSTPLLVFVPIWLIVGLGISFGVSGSAMGWGIATAVMAGLWLAVSLAFGCRCRIYTAVSKDDLPSLTRIWSARAFLRQVKPRIDAVQGLVDAGWVEAERSSAGPTLAPLAAAAEPAPRGRARNSHTPASDLFVLSLFAGALVGLGTTRSDATAWFRVNSAFNLAQLAGAIAVLIQYYRGGLARAMQRLAIATLVLIGVMFYVQTFVFSFTTAAKGMITTGGPNLLALPVTAIHQITNGIGLLLGFIGAAIILRSELRKQPDIIKD